MSNFPEIRYRFTNIDGINYSNIKEIAYKGDRPFEDLGKYMHETESTSDDDSLKGAYIFQSLDNAKIAHKIYKGCTEHDFNACGDDELISELVKRQKDIKLTDFPIGIITAEGRIIGQEIVYYENSPTIFDFSKMTSFDTLDFLPTELYLLILRAMREMFENGIFYLDGHSRNFVVLPIVEGKNPIVKPIDFEANKVDFDRIANFEKEHIFNNLYTLINLSNRNFGLTDKCYKINNEHNSFDETEEKIIRLGDIMQKRC